MKGRILLLLVVFVKTVQAQITINEACSKSYHTIADDFGHYSDWIELYNNSSADVNLNGYHLSDDLLNKNKWTFGNISIKAHGYLLVFASDTNIGTLPAIPASTGEITPYVISYADNLATPIAGKSHVDTLDYPNIVGMENGKNVISARLFLENNIGFGQLNYSISLVYMFFNDKNSPIDKSAFNRVKIKGYIEKGRKITIRFVQQDLEEFWLGYGYVLQGNGIPDYEYEVPIVGEVGKLNLKLLTGVMFEATAPYGKTDIRIKDLKFYHTEWYAHANFKLSSEGETLYLTNPAGTSISQINVPALQADHSYGSKTDGSSSMAVFATPTPGATNNSAASFPGYCDSKLNLSIDAGFYNFPQSLVITGASDIRYTLDGSDPTSTSKQYSGSINIAKTTVVKAACFNGSLPRSIITNTYFINDKSTLPVFSISTHPNNFFNDTTGIYVLGPNADSFNIPFFGANFWEDWERPVYIEFFDKSGKLAFEQGAATEIFGNYSRANPMKSLQLKAKKEYGPDSLGYKFFSDKNIYSFKQIVLRNSGNDFNYTHIWDATNHETVKNTRIDRQAYQPTVVFINGQYWGVHNIREKVGEDYLLNNHGIKKDNIDMSDASGQTLMGECNIANIADMCKSKDMSIEANYKAVADSFDIDNMIDYFAANIYISNWDWPQNNLKIWRPKDGKRQFRYIMFDTDVTLGMYDIFTWQNPSFNQMERLLDTTRVDIHSRIFRSLIKYKPYRDYFINRSADLMNTIYTPANFKSVAYKLRDTIYPEMPKHFARWGYSDWANNIAKLTSFMDKRPSYARAQIQSEFKLKKQVSVTLKVFPAEAGFIKISTIYPTTYPWTGVYYNGVPVEITAYPNPGYTFDHWGSDSITLVSDKNKNILLDIDKNNTFTAYFSGVAAPLNLTISEINYNSSPSADAGDWLELHNYGTAAIDLAGWILKDEMDYNQYAFPSNTIIEANGYLVVYNDSAKFKSIHPQVNNKTGPLGFHLGNEGGQIRLYNLQGKNYLSMAYDNNGAWPAGADGQGYTLELINPANNINTAANWTIGCLQGSPGTERNKNCKEAIPEDISGVQVQCYPNPTNGIFNIILLSGDTDDYQLKIFNIQGQEVYGQPLGNTAKNQVIQIDLSGMPQGIYTIVSVSEKKMIVKKIVLQ